MRWQTDDSNDHIYDHIETEEYSCAVSECEAGWFTQVTTRGDQDRWYVVETTRPHRNDARLWCERMVASLTAFDAAFGKVE